MLMRSVAATVLLLLAGQGLAQAPADNNDLDSIQRQLDQAKAAQAAAARKKAAIAAAKRKQHQAEPPPPDAADAAVAEAERLNREQAEAVRAEQEQTEAARLAAEDSARRAAEEATHYTAFALAWNNQGGFASARGATMEEARQTALNTCIQNNGSCYDSGMVIPPGKKYCFAVAQGQTTQLFSGIAPDIGNAQANALSSCSGTVIGCIVKGSACNGP